MPAIFYNTSLKLLNNYILLAIFDTMISLLKKNILSLITALVIMYLSFANSSTFDNVSIFDIPYMDKIVHMCMYFGLTGILLFENRHRLLSSKSILLLALIPSAYGTLIEFCQSWFTLTRSGDIIDGMFNLLGVILALCIWKVLHLIIKRRN
jgi:hypothetical protein